MEDLEYFACAYCYGFCHFCGDPNKTNDFAKIGQFLACAKCTQVCADCGEKRFTRDMEFNVKWTCSDCRVFVIAITKDLKN